MRNAVVKQKTLEGFLFKIFDVATVPYFRKHHSRVALLTSLYGSRSPTFMSSDMR